MSSEMELSGAGGRMEGNVLFNALNTFYLQLCDIGHDKRPLR